MVKELKDFTKLWKSDNCKIKPSDADILLWKNSEIKVYSFSYIFYGKNSASAENTTGAPSGRSNRNWPIKEGNDCKPICRWYHHYNDTKNKSLNIKKVLAKICYFISFN